MATFCRAIVNGRVLMAGRTWQRALTPELAVVVNVLATPLGTAARDRTYGVREVDNEAPNAAALWRAAVTAALSRWVARGFLRELVVEAEVIPGDGTTTLRSAISFKGRDGRRQSVEMER